MYYVPNAVLAVVLQSGARASESMCKALIP